MNEAAGLAVAVIGLVGVALTAGIWRSRVDRLANVGQSFKDVVEGLTSQDDLQRLASAILLRRFFDPTSEHATSAFRGLHRTTKPVTGLDDPRIPYARAAVDVIAAALRREPPGTLQKVLADGLAYAPTLQAQDLQRANLRGCYIAGQDLAGADLYRADLSFGSVRGSNLTRAQLYEARLVGTVLKAAHLEGANFDFADLTGASFAGSHLRGATFRGARGIPPSVLDGLEGDTYAGDSPLSTGSEDDTNVRPSVFLSVPSAGDQGAFGVVEVVAQTIEECGVDVHRVHVEDYDAASPTQDILRRITACDGVVVIEVPQLHVSNGTWRPGLPGARALTEVWLPTPWNHIEAGMALGMHRPLLVIRQGTDDALLDLRADGHDLVVIDIRPSLRDLRFRDEILTWCNDHVRSRGGAG